MKRFLHLFASILFIISCTNENHKNHDKIAVDSEELKSTWIILEDANEARPSLEEIALDSIVSSYHINILRIPANDTLSLNLEQKNAESFSRLEKKLGENWRVELNKKVASLSHNLSDIWKDKKCTENFNAEDYQQIVVCKLPSMRIEQVYALYIIHNSTADPGKFLLPKIPLNDTIVKTGSYPLEIAYSNISNGELKVELLFPGGITEIEFKTSPTATEIKTIYSPD